MNKVSLIIPYYNAEACFRAHCRCDQQLWEAKIHRCWQQEIESLKKAICTPYGSIKESENEKGRRSYVF